MRAHLAQWLDASETGTALIRAGLRAGWRAGDKSGMGGSPNRVGDDDTRNDVAVLYPPRRAPVYLAVYLTRAQLPAPQRDATLAAVARAVVAEVLA